MEEATLPPGPHRRVILESPYAGDVERNVAYAKACMRDCLARGEAPFASHLLYTQVLDDTKPEERTLGLLLAAAWGPKADATVVYVDLGVSHGMKLGIYGAERDGIPVEYRTLPGWTASGPVG